MANGFSQQLVIYQFLRRHVGCTAWSEPAFSLGSDLYGGTHPARHRPTAGGGNPILADVAAQGASQEFPSPAVFIPLLHPNVPFRHHLLLLLVTDQAVAGDRLLAVSVPALLELGDLFESTRFAGICLAIAATCCLDGELVGTRAKLAGDVDWNEPGIFNFCLVSGVLGVLHLWIICFHFFMSFAGSIGHIGFGSGGLFFRHCL